MNTAGHARTHYRIKEFISKFYHVLRNTTASCILNFAIWIACHAVPMPPTMHRMQLYFTWPSLTWSTLEPAQSGSLKIGLALHMFSGRLFTYTSSCLSNTVWICLTKLCALNQMLRPGPKGRTLPQVSRLNTGKFPGSHWDEGVLLQTGSTTVPLLLLHPQGAGLMCEPLHAKEWLECPPAMSYPSLWMGGVKAASAMHPSEGDIGS